MSNKAVFLDRDGVVNRDRGDYTYSTDDFEFLPGVAESIAAFKKMGYLVIVITNQGGISKGVYTHDDVNDVHDTMCRALSEQGVRIDDVFYCPHHDINERCLCRKPGSLMIEKAIALYDIIPADSYMIGDRPRDIQAAERAGVQGILVEQNSDLSFTLNQIS
jgi:D-glycero-D-manno-heptose 1,7-bisphosphate phosphatase